MTSTTPVRAGRREWLGLAVLALPTTLTSIDATVLHLAAPHLSADLDPSGTELLWILDIYGLLLAGLLITMGTLGDRVGRRRLLLIGSAAFAAASVLAAFSTSPVMLIVARAVLGVAGATLMPSTLSLLRNMFHDPKQRTVATSVWMASLMVGSGLGPVVGGVMLQYFWWGAVFLLAVPVMLVPVILGPFVLPEYRNSEAGRLDFVSVILLLVSMLAMVYGIQHFAEDSANWLPPVAFGVGLVVGIVFVVRQRKLDDPLLDLGLFGNRAFSAAVTVVTLAILVMSGAYFFMGQFLQMVAGLAPFEAGLAILPTAVASIVGILFTPMLVSRVRPGYLMAAELVLATAGVAILTQVSADSGTAVVVIGGVVLSVGIGAAMALCADMIIGSAPAEKAGRASAVQETASQMGTALGIAILGSIGIAVYRGQVAGNLPAGLPPEAARAAEDTIGSAVATAGRLAGSTGDALLSAARTAFAGGMQVAAWASTAITLGIAVLAATLLRGVTKNSGQEPAGAEPEPAEDSRR